MPDRTEQLADWKAKTDAASKGPWEVVLEGGPPAIKMPEGDSYGWVSECSSGVWNCDDPYDDCWRYAAAATNEAEFIAMSRTAMPRILAAVESVLALHTERPLTPFSSAAMVGAASECRACSRGWPCPTVRAIESALEGGDDAE